MTERAPEYRNYNDTVGASYHHIQRGLVNAAAAIARLRVNGSKSDFSMGIAINIRELIQLEKYSQDMNCSEIKGLD